ncbi:MAG: hypothetical protein U9Q82_10730 [Chloroflexota bacterium]|nr:hypothetical protein [Chloroflexota bacterium]
MKSSTRMLWFEDDKKATPLQAAKNAGRYYHKKYGQVPTLIALPGDWANAAQAIEQELGLRVVVDKMVLTRHVAVSAKVTET